jgi:arylformamidase
MKKITRHPANFYEQQYNARASIPDPPHIFQRWATTSEVVRRTMRCSLDLAYGTAAGERLDFFPCGQPDAPLLVFIHGGWWRSLDKSDFSFIAPAFTRAGIDVAITNYTLAPTATIEQITLQQIQAVAWLYRHAADHGFDRKRIVLAGHSAGAHLAAMLMATLWSQVGLDLPTDLIKGGILLSGLYDLAPVMHAQFVNGDLNLTATRCRTLSPARLPQSHRTPFFTAVGGRESNEFKRQNALIGRHWKKAHTGDILLPEDNHLTICDALSASHNALCTTAIALLKMVV